MTAARLTPHQRETLATVRALSGTSRRWVHERDSGAPTALAHLLRKGYLERKVERGPRGGEHRYYRPVPA